MTEEYFLAKTSLIIGASRGGDPPVRVEPGEVFSLDGTEGVNVKVLLRSGAAVRYDRPLPVQQEKDRRGLQKGKRREAK